MPSSTFLTSCPPLLGPPSHQFFLETGHKPQSGPLASYGTLLTDSSGARSYVWSKVLGVYQDAAQRGRARGEGDPCSFVVRVLVPAGVSISGCSRAARPGSPSVVFCFFVVKLGSTYAVKLGVPPWRKLVF